MTQYNDTMRRVQFVEVVVVVRLYIVVICRTYWWCAMRRVQFVKVDVVVRFCLLVQLPKFQK